MRIFRAALLGGAAFVAAATGAIADDAPALGAVDVDALAAAAAPVLPQGSKLLSISKTPQPAVPGLPLSAREKAAFGDTANTIRIMPSTGAPAEGGVSWSGYTRAGVVYQGAD